MSKTKTRVRWGRLAFALAAATTLIAVGWQAPGWASEMRKSRDRGAERELIADLCRLRAEVDAHARETGRLPEDWSELRATPPVDPWGNPYLLTVRQPSGHLAIESLGADGLHGGRGANADWSDFEARVLRD